MGQNNQSKEQDTVPKSSNIDDIGSRIALYTSNYLFVRYTQSARGLAQFSEVPFAFVGIFINLYSLQDTDPSCHCNSEKC